MANPNPYNPSYSFSDWQTSNPAKPLPAPQLDNELANISSSLNFTITALADIRRSDGKLVNQIVTFESLDNDLRAGYSGGAVSAWAAVVDYVAGIAATPIAPATVVVYQGETYVCTVAHTTTALFDVAKWKKIASRGINGTGSGDMLASLNLSDLTNKPQALINIGLGNVDNTHDVDKPISTATQAAIDATNATVAAVTANLALLNWFTGSVPAYVSATSVSFSSGTGLFSGKKHVLPAYTKLLNAVFAAGNNAGMLDTGAIGASKTYFLHAIRNTSTGDCDYLASLSLTPAVPVGWELNSGARVGIILTNGSSQIIQFVQTGNRVLLTAPVTLFTGGTTSAAALITISSLPVGISVDALLVATCTASGPNSDGAMSLWDAAQGSAGMAGCRVHARAAGGTEADSSESNVCPVRTNTSGQVYRAASIAGTVTYTAFGNGWIDWQVRRLFG
jgi:hypothetical protein